MSNKNHFFFSRFCRISNNYLLNVRLFDEAVPRLSLNMFDVAAETLCEYAGPGLKRVKNHGGEETNEVRGGGKKRNNKKKKTPEKSARGKKCEFRTRKTKRDGTRRAPTIHKRRRAETVESGPRCRRRRRHKTVTKSAREPQREKE